MLAQSEMVKVEGGEREGEGERKRKGGMRKRGKTERARERGKVCVGELPVNTCFSARVVVQR